MRSKAKGNSVYVPGGNGVNRSYNKKGESSRLYTPRGYEPRIKEVHGRNGTTRYTTYRPDELSPKRLTPEMLAFLANQQMYGKNYAGSATGMKMLNGCDSTVPARKSAWRDKKVCPACHALLALNGSCQGFCGD